MRNVRKVAEHSSEISCTVGEVMRQVGNRPRLRDAAAEVFRPSGMTRTEFSALRASECKKFLPYGS